MVNAMFAMRRKGGLLQLPKSDGVLAVHCVSAVDIRHYMKTLKSARGEISYSRLFATPLSSRILRFHRDVSRHVVGSSAYGALMIGASQKGQRCSTVWCVYLHLLEQRVIRVGLLRGAVRYSRVSL